MNKMNLIPDIRFPEFNKEWTFEELEQCLDYLQPTPYLVESTDYKNEYETPVLTAGKTFILGYTNEKEGIYTENLPVIIFDDFTTASQFVDFPFKTKSSAMKILLAKNGNNIKFVYEAMQTMNYEVGVHKRHWISVFSKLKIPLPNPQEQQKIASCLSSLDEVIAAHSQKLELLKDHKKGLMQNLFPQESETVPKYRFKEFENDGEWVEKTIDTIKSVLTDYVANGSFQSLRENLNVVDSEDYAFYVRLTDLRASLGHSNQKYVDESTYKFLNKSALFGGELLMANIGANVGEVWQMPYTNKPSTLAPNMLMIKFKKEFDSGFVFQFSTSNQGIKNISKAISGSGHPKISKTDLRQVKVTIPPRIEEQQKIAYCLSSLDALITAQAEKIEQLKLHKKGLMQGLFPKSITN